MQNKIKVGFIQQHNTNDINDNMQRLKKGIEQLAKQGAQLIVLQELHNSLYFCQIETVDNFDLAEPIPGPSTAFFSEIAAANNVVIVTSLFEKRAAGLYHNTSVVIEKMVVLLANTARCTFQTTLLTTKNSTLHLAI